MSSALASNAFVLKTNALEALALLRPQHRATGELEALGAPTRLWLVAALFSGGAFSIAQLAANTEIKRRSVTRQLQVLAEVGVVRDVRM